MEWDGLLRDLWLSIDTLNLKIRVYKFESNYVIFSYLHKFFVIYFHMCVMLFMWHDLLAISQLFLTNTIFN